jgi:hypothetical protein
VAPLVGASVGGIASDSAIAIPGFAEAEQRRAANIQAM